MSPIQLGESQRPMSSASFGIWVLSPFTVTRRSRIMSKTFDRPLTIASRDQKIRTIAHSGANGKPAATEHQRVLHACAGDFAVTVGQRSNVERDAPFGTVEQLYRRLAAREGVEKLGDGVDRFRECPRRLPLTAGKPASPTSKLALFLHSPADAGNRLTHGYAVRLAVHARP